MLKVKDAGLITRLTTIRCPTMEQALNKIRSQIVMVYKGTIVLAKTAADIAQQLHQQRRERVRQELQRGRAAMRVVLLEMRRRGLLKETAPGSERGKETIVYVLNSPFAVQPWNASNSSLTESWPCTRDSGKD